MKNLPYFIFDDMNSLDESLLVQKKNTYKGAARDLSYISVPGRSGDILKDNRRYKNVMIQYDVAAIAKQSLDIAEIARRLREKFLLKVGYYKLRDSYDPRYFRLASYSEEFDLEAEMPELGFSSIAFNCKPMRYLLSGEYVTTFTESGGVLVNPEKCPSKPYIKITGSGDISLFISNTVFHFRGVEEYIELDSEAMIAYKGNVNENNKMYTPEYPMLFAGANIIEWTGNVSKIEIKPRWCTL